MSRSFRHTPCSSNGGPSEKEDKRIYNRCLRSKVRRILRDTRRDFDDLVLPIIREMSNPWDMAKDGKGYDSGLARQFSFKEKVRFTRENRCRVVVRENEHSLARAEEDRIAYVCGFAWFQWMGSYFDLRDIRRFHRCMVK